MHASVSSPALLIAAALLVAVAACAPAGGSGTGAAGGAEPAARRDHAVRVVPIDDARRDRAATDGGADAAHFVRVEVVSTNTARRRGLGGRPRLDDDAGMLFVYDRAEPRAFWMKDCLLALDIAYLDAGGRVVDLVTLPPGAGLPDGDVPRSPTSRPALYVLETNAGWFEARGIGVGARIDVGAAVRGVVAEPRR